MKKKWSITISNFKVRFFAFNEMYKERTTVYITVITQSNFENFIGIYTFIKTETNSTCYLILIISFKILFLLKIGLCRSILSSTSD